MSAELIAEAKRLARFAPEKPESVHDVVCAGFNALDQQLAGRTRDFMAAVERNEEKDRRIADLEEQLEAARYRAASADAFIVKMGMTYRYLEFLQERGVPPKDYPHLGPGRCGNCGEPLDAEHSCGAYPTRES